MTTQTKRGRPRPLEVIERDRTILSFIKQRPYSRNELCQKTGLSGSLVWLSLDRLRKGGEAKPCRGFGESVWTSRVDEPCP